MSEASDYKPWEHKPWWCQPWSILLTGFTIIFGTWFLSHIIWLTIAIAIPLSAWMGFFVLVWPSMMRQYMVENSVQEAGGTEV
ncbi:MAG: DUF6737 family protein [Thermosynechococcaceae cyanobacterium]